MRKEQLVHQISEMLAKSPVFDGFSRAQIEAIILCGARKDELDKMVVNVAVEEIVLKLKAHSILMKANMGPGYTREEASRATMLAINEIPADVRYSILQKIADGDKEMIDLYRWPMSGRNQKLVFKEALIADDDPIPVTGRMRLMRIIAALENAAAETTSVDDWKWWSGGSFYLQQHLDSDGRRGQ